MIYNQYKTDLQDILKQLYSYKGVEILEGHLIAYVSQHTAED